VPDVDRREQDAWSADSSMKSGTGNWATADELYAPNYVNHDPYNPDQGTGPEGLKQRVSGYRNVFHDFNRHYWLAGYRGWAAAGRSRPGPPAASRAPETPVLRASGPIIAAMKER
jgi:hypothetical protein